LLHHYDMAAALRPLDGRPLAGRTGADHN